MSLIDTMTDEDDLITHTVLTTDSHNFFVKIALVAIAILLVGGPR